VVGHGAALSASDDVVDTGVESVGPRTDEASYDRFGELVVDAW